MQSVTGRAIATTAVWDYSPSIFDPHMIPGKPRTRLAFPHSNNPALHIIDLSVRMRAVSAIVIALITVCSLVTARHAKQHIQDSSSATRRILIDLPTGVNFDKALEAVNKAANLVYQRFEFHNKVTFQFFLESSNMPTYAWDLIKYKLALKILSGQSSYLMIFGGSSVTAGHDNYYNQSYPFVFERRVKPIFDALAVELQVHNIAQGANNCRPSDHCYAAMGGDNADFYGWEQSFNCGRSKDVMEFMARYAYWSGAVIYYVASGAFLPDGCAPSSDKVPWISENWTPELEGITSKYAVSPELASKYRQLQSDWYDDGNSVSRFTNQVYGGLYKGTGPHGYSVWGHSGKLCNNGTGCNAIDMKGECHDKGGPHWMVQETSYYAMDRNKKGKSWHPSAGMHLLRGELLAYNYAHILADTIFMLQNDTKQTTNLSALIDKYHAKWVELRVPIPEKALHSGSEETQVLPTCYTNFRPHFNPKYLLKNIVLGNLTEWRYYDTSEWGQESVYGFKDERPFFEV